MSTKVLGQVWDLDLRSTLKFVLVSLADQANDEGVCWPSIKGRFSDRSICKRTSLGERTVQDGIRELERMGYLEIEARPGSSNLYRINLMKLQEGLFSDPEGCRSRTPAGAAPPQELRVGGAGAAGKGCESRTQNRQGTVKNRESGDRPVADRRALADALVRWWGVEADSARANEQFRVGLKQLAEQGATPDQVEAVTETKAWEAHFGNDRRGEPMTKTPLALAKHWPILLAVAERLKAKRSPVRLEADPAKQRRQLTRACREAGLEVSDERSVEDLEFLLDMTRLGRRVDPATMEVLA